MVQVKREDDQLGSRITIQDVADTAGVSVATVSRVLNGHPDVSAATRVEVLRHIRELGYVSNRALSIPQHDVRTRGKTRLIGLSVPRIRSEYVTEIVSGAVDALHERDARLVICSEGKTPGLLREQLMPGVTNGALIILPSNGKEELAGLYQSGYPFVVIEPTVALDSPIPSVAATNWAGAKKATEYLIDLGHTHIAIITGPEHWQISQDRLDGYHAALMTAGLPLVPNLRRLGGVQVEHGRGIMLDLLSLNHVPSAILTFNTAVAVGVLRAARERGLQVPEDLSVLTLDDIELASLISPALTAVRQPLQGQGRVGADMLFRLLEGQQLDAMRIELSNELIIRDSTTEPRGTSFLT